MKRIVINLGGIQHRHPSTINFAFLQDLNRLLHPGREYNCFLELTCLFACFKVEAIGGATLFAPAKLPRTRNLVFLNQGVKAWRIRRICPAGFMILAIKRFKDAVSRHVVVEVFYRFPRTVDDKSFRFMAYRIANRGDAVATADGITDFDREILDRCRFQHDNFAGVNCSILTVPHA